MDRDESKQIEAQFIGLVSILANSALQQLGKVMNPMTGKVERNLESARMTIEWLRMLKIKSQGNLNVDEERILTSYISNLQLNYVDECEKQDTSAENDAEKESAATEQPTQPEAQNKQDSSKQTTSSES